MAGVWSVEFWNVRGYIGRAVSSCILASLWRAPTNTLFACIACAAKMRDLVGLNLCAAARGSEASVEKVGREVEEKTNSA